jgi:hypothetical protein
MACSGGGGSYFTEVVKLTAPLNRTWNFTFTVQYASSVVLRRLSVVTLPSSLILFILMMEEVSYSEMSVLTRAT